MWLTTEDDDQSSLHCVIVSTDVMSDHYCYLSECSLCYYRVPYQNVVVGLVSNQLLIQCVCVLLLRGTPNTVPAEQGIVSDSSAAVDAASSSASAAGNCHGDDTGNLLASIPPLPGRNLSSSITMTSSLLWRPPQAAILE